MDGNDLLRLGYRPGKIIGLALHAADAARADGAADDDILSDLADVLNAPADYLEDPIYGRVAEALAAYEAHRERSASYNLDSAAPYRVWGADGIEVRRAGPDETRRASAGGDSRRADAGRSPGLRPADWRRAGDR